MSFFRGGGSNNTPPPNPPYNRLPDNRDYNLPSGPRAGQRPPPQMPYNPPQNAYNDPSGALFEKRGYDRKPPPSGRMGGFVEFLRLDLTPL